MELQRQKGRLRTAVRGHKLLKDKSDQMIREFMVLAKQNKQLREQLDAQIAAALKLFLKARIQMSAPEIEATLSRSQAKLVLTTGVSNIMGLRVPKIDLEPVNFELDYGVLGTSASFDSSVTSLFKLTDGLMKLAEVEKATDMLATEIVKLKRRINALEYILMPQIQATIRFIRMKLAENERSQLVRVMKIKANLHSDN